MLPGVCSLRRINHVSLRVRDLHESVRFYCDLFGLEERSVQPASLISRQCVSCRGTGGGYFGVVLVQGLPSSMELAGLDHIGFEVPTLEAVVELYRRAQSRDLRVTRPRIYDGHWQIFIFDPDGYKIEIMTGENQEQSLPVLAERADTDERPASRLETANPDVQNLYPEVREQAADKPQ